MGPIIGGNNPGAVRPGLMICGIERQRTARKGTARLGAGDSLNSSPRYCAAYLCHSNAEDMKTNPTNPDNPTAISTKSWRTAPATTRADSEGGKGARYLTIPEKGAAFGFFFSYLSLIGVMNCIENIHKMKKPKNISLA